jgi:hypothetical protein
MPQWRFLIASLHHVAARRQIHIFCAEKEWELSNSGIPVVHAATKLELRNLMRGNFF